MSRIGKALVRRAIADRTSEVDGIRSVGAPGAALVYGLRGRCLEPVPLPLARADLVKDRVDTGTEARELLVDDLPDEIEVNAEIVMDEFVAHPGNLSPR